jgi:hypothetical protein
MASRATSVRRAALAPRGVRIDDDEGLPVVVDVEIDVRRQAIGRPAN